MAIGMALWAAALVAPAGFILIGITRLARNLDSVRDRGPRRSTALRALADLPADIVVASGLALPDGRGVSELVIGPFGAAVVRELPPAAVTRIRNGQWELRTSKRWVPLENPLERASRDAERVRRWLGHDDADFVVKVYAAVVGPAPTVERTAGCAVLSPDQLGRWIGALPAAAQPDRRPPRAGPGPRSRSRRLTDPPTHGAAHDAAHGRRLVGEPGLEPGTSGI